jgi:hypothetical protein
MDNRRICGIAITLRLLHDWIRRELGQFILRTDTFLRADRSLFRVVPTEKSESIEKSGDVSSWP